MGFKLLCDLRSQTAFLTEQSPSVAVGECGRYAGRDHPQQGYRETTALREGGTVNLVKNQSHPVPKGENSEKTQTRCLEALFLLPKDARKYHPMVQVRTAESEKSNTQHTIIFGLANLLCVPNCQKILCFSFQWLRGSFISEMSLKAS